MSAGDPNNSEQRIAALEAALRHRERQIEAVRRTSDRLFARSSVEEMLRETLALAIEVLHADAGTLLLHNPLDDTLVFRTVIGPAAARLTGYAIPASEGIAGRVFRTGLPDLVPHVRERPDHRPLDHVTGYHVESLMSVPIKRAGNKPIGTMQIVNVDKSFDARDLEVLEVLSAVAAAAIENARLLQEARKAQIANVIGDVSHDIKNLLTPIQTGVWTLRPLLDRLFVDLDAVGARCPPNQIWAEEIAQAVSGARPNYGWILANALEAADQVQARTKEIADAVKGELSPPHFEVADVNETVRDVVRALRPVAEKVDVPLRLDLDPQLPRAEVDRKQIYNALYNLVSNALAETPPGGTVTLRTRPIDGEKVLQIDVEDTGRGISPLVRDHLFTEETISTKPGGTGLGTRIVANIVRRHGGTITVRSEEGHGAQFTIRLPLSHDAALSGP